MGGTRETALSPVWPDLSGGTVVRCLKVRELRLLALLNTLYMLLTFPCLHAFFQYLMGYLYVQPNTLAAVQMVGGLQ